MTDAKPTNLRVTYTNRATVNTGNFQNLNPGYEVSGDVPEGTHPTAARNQLKVLVDAWLEEDIAAIKADLQGS